MKENAKDLLKMKEEGAEVLYGIRFLSIALIVMDHQIGIFNSGPVSDGMRLDQVSYCNCFLVTHIVVYLCAGHVIAKIAVLLYNKEAA